MIQMSNINSFNDLSDEQKEYYEYELQLTRDLYSYEQEKIYELKKEQKTNKGKLLSSLLLLIKGIKLNNGYLNINENNSSKLIKKINKEIDDIFKNEIISEKIEIEKILNEVIDFSYDINSYLTSLSDDSYNPTELSDVIKTKILNSKIENKTYKDRIEKNKNKISDKIKNNIEKFLIGTITLEALKELLDKNLGTNNFNTERLAKDQISRKYSSSKEQWAKDNNIEVKIWISILCDTTCGKCRQRHLKVFDIKDNSIEIPAHINCYCYWFYVPLKNYKINKDKISWKEFLKWKGVE